MTYWYVATPYSNHPDGHEAAFLDACFAAAQLYLLGYPVFCPISHSHPLADTGVLPRTDHEFWMEFDRPFMETATGLIVVQMPGWDESKGVAFEIDHFKKAGKTILYATWPEIQVCLI